MRAMEDLRDMLCDELDKIAEKGEMTTGMLDNVYKLSQSMVNLDVIMEHNEEWSGAGEWEARGNYDRGNSNTNRGMHYVRGHYSRDSGISRTGYGRDDWDQSMMDRPMMPRRR